MNNDVLADAICGLATAIRLLNINDLSSQAAARVEAVIQNARLEEQRILADSFEDFVNTRASRAASAQEPNKAADEPKRALAPAAAGIELGS